MPSSNIMYVVRADPYLATIEGEVRALGGTLAVCTTPEAALAARRLADSSGHYVEWFIEEQQAPWDFGRVRNPMGRYPRTPDPEPTEDLGFSRVCDLCSSHTHLTYQCAEMRPERLS